MPRATETTLLAVFAHPDDEAYRPGGTLALLAGRGVSVHLLAATRGEAGSCGDPPCARLSSYLLCASASCVAPARAGHPTAAPAGYHDGHLSEANPSR